MKSMQLTAFSLDKIIEHEAPTRALGANEIRVAIRAVSINRRDLLMCEGLYNARQALPLVPLSDGVGEVIEVGEAVTVRRVGERVALLFCPLWQDGRATQDAIRKTRGGPLEGSLQDEIVVGENEVRGVPQYLSDEEAACLPCAALTAWSALFEHGNLQKGDDVLLLGTGGVSLFALQFAHAHGARVFITSKDDGKLARAKALGASFTTNYLDDESWHKSVLKDTDGRGVDHVIEVGGAGTFDKSVRATAAGGQVHLIGVLAGEKTVNLTAVLMKNIKVQGILVGHAKGFENMCAFMNEHKIRPIVDEVFKFSEIKEAFLRMKRGEHFGKIVLKP